MSAAAHAFIAFLRCEASQAEERAKSLRATAASIEANNLEGTVKKRKRHVGRDSSSRPKKVNTAYGLFVHENFELMRKGHPDLPAKEIISHMEGQWMTMSEEEKHIWKYRLESLTEQDMVPISALPMELVGEELAADEDVATKKRAGKTSKERLETVSV